MNPKKASENLKRISFELKAALNNKIPKKAANHAVMFFKESFQNEGFTGRSLEKWQEVKRRETPKRPSRASASRPILTGDTGDLGSSIKMEVKGQKVTITSDVPYATAHNEGTRNAGRSRNVVIPKRQFIGESETLTKELDEMIKKELGKIFGN